MLQLRPVDHDPETNAFRTKRLFATLFAPSHNRLSLWNTNLITGRFFPVELKRGGCREEFPEGW